MMSEINPLMFAKDKYDVTIQAMEDMPYWPKGNRNCMGWYVKEEWKLDGILHRQFGPAVKIFEPELGRSIRHEYYDGGQLHRYGGPAIIDFDPDTGEIAAVRFFERGKEVLPREPHLYRTIPVINGP
jgi:hypothetical protein